MYNVKLKKVLQYGLLDIILYYIILYYIILYYIILYYQAAKILANAL